MGYRPWDCKELNTTGLLNHHLLLILFIYSTDESLLKTAW